MSRLINVHVGYQTKMPCNGIQDALPCSFTPQDQPHLRDSIPKLLHPRRRLSFRPQLICLIHRRLASHDIRFLRLHPLRPLEDLPEQVQARINGYPDICSHEVIDIEPLPMLGRKDIEAVEQQDQSEEAEAEPG